MMNNNSDSKECKIFHWQFPAIIQAERMAEYAVIVSEKAFLETNGTKGGKERKDGKSGQAIYRLILLLQQKHFNN